MAGVQPIPAEPVLASRNLGGFILREKIGSGGFGDVYLAEQPELNREAIVKILRPEVRDERNAQRFLREARLASRLDHPYAAHIYKFGAEDDGVFWIAMERVRGASLREVIEAQGPMSLDRFVPLLEKICEVVHTAHEQGIVHRDLKPDNVMVISRAGRLLPKLLDFGIARASSEPERIDPVAFDVTINRPVEVHTQRGDVLGSPPYMAPELWVNARDVGPPADQYALAALAYEALTGKLAFTGRTVYDVARAHAKSARPPLGATFPPEVDRVLARALARKPADRFGNVLELAQAFRAASGVGSERDLPQIDDEQRTRLLTSAPQPIADAIAAYDASRNPHQGREALRGIVRNACWYLGILALASRSRVGSGGAAETERTRRLLRDLRRQGLAPVGWAALATQLTEPFVRLPDTHPLPELVRLLHGEAADVFASALEGSLFESLADSTDDAAAQAIARELPIVGSLLRALGEVLEYRLVVPRGDRGDSWMGVRGARGVVALQRALPDGQPVIVDGQGSPVLVLWPLVQVAVPVPGHPEQLFLLAGPGRQGVAKLVSTPHDFEHQDDALWEWFRDHLFHPAEGGTDAAREASPFRGLASYTTSDAAWFFGRERDVEILVNRLRLEAFVAVVGPSGVGKSSFVHAGVAPCLARTVVSTRPGHAPLARLRQQLDQAGLEVAASDDVEHFATHLLASAAEHHGLLLVVDQFEELFTLGCPAAERDAFTGLLLAITRTPASPVRVVITLRDDFLIRAEQLPGLGAVLARGLQLLGPLGPDDLQRVLVETIQRSGYQFEDRELPARMVAAVEGTPAAVALISFTAARLWELRDRQFRQLPRKAYDAIGGVGGALARHADEVVERLPPADQGLVRKAFRHLVTYEGTRAIIERQELVDMLGGGDADRLIERLVEARLLISGDSERGPTIEIIHEVLLTAWPRLTEWRREDSEGSRLHEQLRAAAKQWQDRGRPRGLLWRGDALTEYQLWRKRHPDELAPVDAAFGAASVREAMRTQRVRRALVAVTIVVTAVFILILVRANRAEQQSRRASENLLREASFEQGRLLELEGNKLAALPHLLDAYRMGDTGEANRLLIEEASRSIRATVVTLEGHQDKLSRIAVSADGKRIATTSLDHTLRLWDAASGAALAAIPLRGRGIDLVFAHDGKHLVASTTDEVLVVDVDAATVAHRLPLGGTATVSPDDRQILVGARDKLASFDLASGNLLREVPHASSVHVAYCERAACFATWGESGEVTISDPVTLAPRTRLVADKGVFAGAVSPDGSLVVVGSETGAVTFLYADGRTVTRDGHKQHVYDISFSADGSVVGTASHDGTARLWTAATGELRATLVGHRANVTSIRFSPAGDLIATSSADGTVRLWSSEGTPVGDLDGHTNAILELAFAGDGKRLATASWDHRAIVWDVGAALGVRASVAVKPAIEATPRIAFRADSKRAALVGADDTIAVIDLESGRTICRTTRRPVDQVVWSASGAWFASFATEGHTVDVWNAESCGFVRELAHPAEVTAIAAIAGDQILTGAEDRTLRVWNLRDGSLAGTRPNLPGSPITVGVDADRWFACVFGTRAAVVLLDPRSDDRVILEGGEMPIYAIERAGGTTFAAGLDQHLWMFDEATRAGPRLEASGPLMAVRGSSDRRFIVGVGGVSPTVWDGETLLQRGTLDGHTNLTLAGGFVGDRVFITSSADGTARVWDLATLRPLLVFHGAVGNADVVIAPDRSTVIIQTGTTTRIWNPRFATPTDDLLLHFK